MIIELCKESAPHLISAFTTYILYTLHSFLILAVRSCTTTAIRRQAADGKREGQSSSRQMMKKVPGAGQTLETQLSKLAYANPYQHPTLKPSSLSTTLSSRKIFSFSFHPNSLNLRSPSSHPTPRLGSPKTSAFHSPRPRIFQIAPLLTLFHPLTHEILLSSGVTSQ